MANTPRLELRRPQGGDNFTPSADLTNHADILDNAAIDQSGTLAGIPAAGDVPIGTYYFATDAEVTYRSNGSDWKVVGVRPDGNIETAELADDAVTAAKLADAAKLGLNESGTVRRGKCIVATQESRTNTAYGKLATPDEVENVVLETAGFIEIDFLAIWQCSVADAARAAIFIGENQLKIDRGTVNPVLQAAWINTYDGMPDVPTVLGTSPQGLVSGGTATVVTSDPVTTGQVLGAAPVYTGNMELDGNPLTFSELFLGGSVRVEVAAGTYDISVRFKSASGSVTVKNRRLRVWTQAF